MSGPPRTLGVSSASHTSQLHGPAALVFRPPSLDAPGEGSAQAQESRNVLVARAADILNDGWEQSTRRSYERALRVDVYGCEREVEATLLPVDSADKLIILFAAMDGMSWSRIRLNKSAVRAWHVVNEAACIFDSCWDCRARQFWRGLKKRAKHVHHRKRGVTLHDHRKRGVTLRELYQITNSRLSTGK